MPNKFGVAAHGKYYGKVLCSSQIEEGNGKYHQKEKWIDRDGWKHTGDRMKPHWAERKGRRLPTKTEWEQRQKQAWN